MSAGTVPVSKLKVQFRPTIAGWFVLGAAAFAILQANDSRLAIGMFPALIVAVVADMFLSRKLVRDRRAAVTPIRLISTADAGIAFRAEVPAGSHAVTLTLSPLQVHDVLPAPVVVMADETSAILEAGKGYSRHRRFVRWCSSATYIGLVWAHRWEAAAVPPVFRGPDDVGDLDLSGIVTSVDQIREYVPGDRMSRVSWTATARTGQMHVRSEAVGSDEVVVVLDLARHGHEHTVLRSGEIDEDTGALYQALVTHVNLTALVCRSSLRRGYPVRLITMQLPEAYYTLERDRALESPSESSEPTLHSTVSGDVLIDGELIGQPVLVDDLVFDETDVTRRLAMAEPVGTVSWPGPHLLVADGTIKQVNG